MSAENSSEIAQRNIIIKIGERLGLVISPEREAEIMKLQNERLEKYKKEEALWEQQLQALLHSDACTGEIDYVLGISSVDPHPDHVITFNSDFPFPESDSKVSTDSNDI